MLPHILSALFAGALTHYPSRQSFRRAADFPAKRKRNKTKAKKRSNGRNGLH